MAHEPQDSGTDLVLEHGRWVRGLARALVHDEHDREDVVQDTWVAALEGRMRHQDAPRPWLARVLGNFARLHRRRERVVRAREERAARPDIDETDPARLLARAELLQRVGSAVLELEEPYRSTLLLRFLEELSTDEVARRLGVPGSTVRNRIRRGLAKLRERFDAEHGGDSRAWCALLVPGMSVPLWKPVAISAGVWTMTKTMTIAVSAGIALFLGILAWQGLGWPAESASRANAATDDAELASIESESVEGESVTLSAPAIAADARTAAVVPASPPALDGLVVIRGLETPVAGIAVWIESDPNAKGAAEVEPREVVRTDEQGRFELAELPALDQLLIFRGAGFLERKVWAEEIPRTPEGVLVVETLPLGVLELEIVDAEGAPVANTVVWVRAMVSISSHPRAWTMNENVEGLTDAFGRCTLNGIPCSSALMIRIGGAGLGEPNFPSIDARTRILRRRFVHSFPGSISGIVTHADGTPVGGLVDLDSSRGLYSPRQAFIDGEGGFAFEDVPAGKALISIPAVGIDTLEIDVPSGRQLELDPIVVPNAVRVAGTVRSSFGLTPVDFMVELYRAGERLAGPLWLDADGHFTASVSWGPALLRVVQVDTVNNRLENGTYRRTVARELGDVARVLIEAPAADLEVWIDARAGALEGRIAGLAQDEERTVVLELLLPRRRTNDPVNLLDPYAYGHVLELTDGRFRSRAIHPGTFDALVVVAGLGHALLPSVEVTAGRVTDLGTIELADADLTGTVRDAEGQPISGAVVTVRPRRGGEEKAITDTEGAYRFEALRQGVLRLQAVHGEFGNSAQATIMLGREGATQDLRLVPRAEIRGRLILKGESTSGADVLLMRRRAANFYAIQSTTKADGSGAFVFDDLEAGEYGVSHGALLRFVDLTDGSSLEVVLEELEPTIELMVRHRGRPLEGIRSLSLTPLDPGSEFGFQVEALVTEGNRVLVPPLAERYYFRVTTDLHTDPGLSGWVEASAEAPLLLETACGDLLVRCRDPHGPAPAVFVIELGGMRDFPFPPQAPPARRSPDGWRFPAIAHGTLLRLEGFDEDGDWITKEWRFPDASEATLSWP